MERLEVADRGVEQASAEFVGRWNRLVSTTNWEKGRIIHEWRQSLIDQGAPAADYSDEAWSKRVGGVSGQHTGRLRRVFHRFASGREQFPGLFWSHYQAALDWDDAEMWLEGAVRQSWSVSQMRQQRWEALGLPEDLKPFDEEVKAEEVDQDNAEPKQAPQAVESEFDAVREPMSPAGPDFGDEDDDDSEYGESRSSETGGGVEEESASFAREQVRPFEGLSQLPEDLADALDAFKIAIVHHKQLRWRDVSADDVLAALDGLKQLVLAPSA
ncbi:MAG: hypothetical protein U0795_23585 [Pirellulales bacterium]